MNAAMIVDELVRRGYRSVPQPLHVADIDFDFAGALTGPNDQESLTLILDGDAQTFGAALRRLRAFAMVLDRSGSNRPINVVVFSKQIDPSALAALQETARVISIDPERPLSESLSSLWPLALPDPVATSGSAEAALLEELGSKPDSMHARLIRAAREGAQKVESTMQKILQENLGDDK